MKDPYEPNWVREDRRPTIVVDNDLKEATFVAQVGDKPSLWGDVSAIDLLDFPTQRGPNKLSTDLGLLFAASGDLRNVVRSLLSLPEQYRGTCTVVINDNDSTVVVRNILLLLVAYQIFRRSSGPHDDPSLVFHLLAQMHGRCLAEDGSATD
jgi:hypothetical protein